MNPMDRWLAELSASAAAGWSDGAAERVHARLANERSLAKWANSRQLRMALTCVGIAALAAFVTTTTLELGSSYRQPPRWPASAIAASPSVLLLTDARG